MRLTPIHKSWGTIVEFDNPLDFFNESTDYWRQLIYQRKLLVFKKMNFTELDYAKFGHSFGKPWNQQDYIYSNERSITLSENDKTYHITEFSNKIHSTKIISNDVMAWHADIPNRKENPFPHRALWIVKNPNNVESGNTYWLNIEDGIEYLSPKLKELISRVTILQQSWYSMGTDEQLHDFIKIHPVTGNKSLRLNYYVRHGHLNAWIKEVYIDNIKQLDCSLIQTYIDELLEHPELYHKHVWDTYDIAIYDNYSFIHGRTKLVLGSDVSDNERKFYRMNIDHIKI